MKQSPLAQVDAAAIVRQTPLFRSNRDRKFGSVREATQKIAAQSSSGSQHDAKRQKTQRVEGSIEGDDTGRDWPEFADDDDDGGFGGMDLVDDTDDPSTDAQKMGHKFPTARVSANR